MKKRTLLNTLFSTIAIIVALSSCSKDKINQEKTPTTITSEQSYKEKLQAFIASNNKNASQSGLNLSSTENKVSKQFASYKEAYEFFAQLQKGVISHGVDTVIATTAANKNMSTMAVTYGFTNYQYSNACSGSAGISGTWGTGTITGTWNINGNIGYSWTQSSPTAPKNYTQAQPNGTTLSEPYMAYSGVGTMESSAGAWNGSAASYYQERHAQVEYTVTGPIGSNGSAALKVRFTTGIGWSTQPGSVYISYSMTAQAY